ncbi:MAG: hypothetical protein M1833_001626 [Piccolia ochrophora]|nr:MAG: hypothetical protein M1833_001626 [Piccolia ochrophora]
MSVLMFQTVVSRQVCRLGRRKVSTLSGHPHIYIFPDPRALRSSHLLSLLPTSPPRPDLALGTSTKLPPTTDSFSENPDIFPVIHEVLKTHAVEDEEVQAQAKAMASSGGAGLGSGGAFFPGQSKRKRGAHGGGGGVGGDSAGGASAQGGPGGAGVGGFVHVYDSRNTPSFGRTPYPEDIFGSLEVDGNGNFEDNGRYQPSGTYRILTNEGILGLSSYLRRKLTDKLAAIEKFTKQ